MKDSLQPWYHEGLRFRCTRCGNCCRGAGNVWVDEDDVVRLAAGRDLTADAFRSAYTRPAGPGGRVLRQKPDRDCVFWSEASGCTVYGERPRQCRSYPFWQGILHSPADWRDEARSCPGIDRGNLHPAEEITETAARDGIPTHRTRVRVGPDAGRDEPAT